MILQYMMYAPSVKACEPKPSEPIKVETKQGGLWQRLHKIFTRIFGRAPIEKPVNLAPVIIRVPKKQPPGLYGIYLDR